MVHGGLALAAAIGRGTRVEATRSDAFTIQTPFSESGAPQGPARSPPLPVESVVRELYRKNSSEPRVRLRITSNLPSGAGLGSSASTMVAAVAAVSKMEGWAMDDETMIEAAMLGEKMVHGKPSGVDVAAAVYGGLLEFRVGEPPRKVALGSPAMFLVVYSGKRRNTGRLVSKVSSMKDVYPALFGKLCQSATQVSELAKERLVGGRLEELGEIMTYNHAVLAMVGASNEHLDRLVDLCIQSGCLGAKLTGAGGGGSVLAVTNRGEEETVAERVSRSGFDTFVAKVPTGGVRAWTIG